MRLTKKTIEIEQQSQVLSKAFLRLSDQLALNQRQLGEIIGASEATISRLYKGEKNIDPNSKEGELALMLIRVFRSLDAILGGDRENCLRWLKSYNAHLNGIPAELIKQVTGLVAVANYLDVIRGKL